MLQDHVILALQERIVFTMFDEIFEVGIRIVWNFLFESYRASWIFYYLVLYSLTLCLALHV